MNEHKRVSKYSWQLPWITSKLFLKRFTVWLHLFCAEAWVIEKNDIVTQKLFTCNNNITYSHTLVLIFELSF